MLGDGEAEPRRGLIRAMFLVAVVGTSAALVWLAGDTGSEIDSQMYLLIAASIPLGLVPALAPRAVPVDWEAHIGSVRAVLRWIAGLAGVMLAVGSLAYIRVLEVDGADPSWFLVVAVLPVVALGTALLAWLAGIMVVLPAVNTIAVLVLLARCRAFPARSFWMGAVLVLVVALGVAAVAGIDDTQNDTNRVSGAEVLALFGPIANGVEVDPPYLWAARGVLVALAASVLTLRRTLRETKATTGDAPG